MRRRGVVLVLTALGVLAAACGAGADGRPTLAEGPAKSTTTTSSVAPVTEPPVTEPPTTAPPPPPPTTAPPPPPPPVDPVAEARAREVAVYSGLGAWVDVYDWSLTFGKDGPLVEPGTVDVMVQRGVQTLYIQTAKAEAPFDVLEPERLLPIIERARAQGIRVVAWYLPTLEDPGADLQRLLAAARLPVDGVAVDIESRKVDPPEERTRRLLEISHAFRAALPGRIIGAIPFPPVIMEVVNPNYWPGFPWAELAGIYDVWLPMNYQSFRPVGTEYRDAYRYTAENIDRMRANLRQPEALVHTIGGIADETSPEDVDAMLRASVERRVIGGSLYDWRTTGDHLWPALQRFRVEGD